VLERYGGVRALGEYELLSYHAQRQATLPVGTRTAYRFNANGDPIANRAITLTQADQASFDETAMFGGRRYAHITSGTLSGFWLPVQGLTLA
jgi:hypothetical protein